MADRALVARRKLTPKNFLFVCSQNRWRSPTAEQIFAGKRGINVLSAGTHRHAQEPLSSELIEWADTIFAMEGIHRSRIQRDFRSLLNDTPIVVLGIRDDYRFMDPALVKLLKSKMQRWLP